MISAEFTHYAENSGRSFAAEAIKGPDEDDTELSLSGIHNQPGEFTLMTGTPCRFLFLVEGDNLEIALLCPLREGNGLIFGVLLAR